MNQLIANTVAELALPLQSKLMTRMEGLHSYVNGDELTVLSNLHAEIEYGLAAIRRAEWFLANVPVGAYDANRRAYGFPVEIP